MHHKLSKVASNVFNMWRELQIKLTIFWCFVVVLTSGNGANPCNNMDLAEAEKNFLEAFAVGFNQSKMSAKSQQTAYCLQNKNVSLSLKQIPRCFKPRYCLLCRVATYAMIASYTRAPNVKQLTIVLVGLCKVAELPEEYCSQLASIYVNPIHEILKKNTAISPDDICAMAFGSIGCIEYPEKRLPPSSVTISEEDFKASVSVTRKNVNPIKILHVTDVHYDPEYRAGIESPEQREKCTKTFACCRKPTDVNSQENYWGSYHSCDTPKRLLENSLKEMAQRHTDVKLVYLTGDIVRHHIAEVNLDNMQNDSIYVFQQFMKAFKGKPILFALGNHDTDVFGMFSPNQSDNSAQAKVYAFYKEWTEKLWNNGKLIDNPKKIQWPPNGEGYYTVQLKERLRVVVLNSNVPYFYNWWLLSEGHFYHQQLQWLERVLNQTEKVHQKVHILSHIAPNHHSLLPGWSEQYQAIIKRYRNTIVAQFNGHSHDDEFSLFYDSDKPVNVAWNGGSLTPHENKDPNYHVITVEPNHFTVSVRESYSMDLAEANKNQPKDPQWQLDYNMTQEYALSDLSLHSLDGLVKAMAKDDKLVEKFWRHKVKNQATANEGLSPECKASVICSIVTSKFEDPKKCEWIKNTINWSSYDKRKICPSL